jgi:hypothetical protein
MLENLVDDKGNVSPDQVTGLDVQILQMHGDSQTVVADSNPYAGSTYDTYTQLTGDGANLDAGKYVVKVNRDSTADQLANYFYSFQFAGDRYYQDFDTVQTPPPQTQGQSLLSFLAQDAVVGLMAGSVDTTMAMAGQASLPINGAALTAGQDDQTDPAVKLLNMFA